MMSWPTASAAETALASAFNLWPAAWQILPGPAATTLDGLEVRRILSRAENHRPVRRAGAGGMKNAFEDCPEVPRMSPASTARTMKSETPWQSARLPRFPSLKKDLSCDVLVVGGGITGLTAAYQLKQAGRKVCLLERDRLGFGDTGLTTAHLTYVTDLRVAQLAKTFGDDAAGCVWQGGKLAIDTIEATIEREGIDCDFRRVPGYLCAPLDSNQDESKSLRRDAEVANRLGFSARYLEKVPFLNRPGVQFPNQAKFHPLKYLAGLARAIDGGGSRIFEHSEATEFKDKPLRVVAGGKTVSAASVVIATHVPLMGKAGLTSAALLQSKIFPYTSYAIGAKLPKGFIPEASFWDVSDPYYYLRIEAGRTSDYAIFGGQDHKTGQEPDTKKRFDKLAKVLLQLIPQARPTGAGRVR